MRLHKQDNHLGLMVTVHRDIPDVWPSAATPGNEHCHIFQTREFVEAWMASFGLSPRLGAYFVVVRSAAGTPLMLLPLSLERRRGLSILSFIDQGQADYNAPILFEPAPEWTEGWVRSLWSQILALLPPVDVVVFEKMPATVGPLANPLYLLAEGPDTASSHGNQLQRPWAEVERHLNSPKELRKKERGLARIAAPEFVVADEPRQRAWLLERLIEQKQRRFEDTRVPGFGENPAALLFLQAATGIFAQSGNLMLSALMVGEEAAAIQWGLVQNKVFYALVTSFADGPLADFSCGRILNYRLIKWLHERDYAYFDQGFGDEAYKLLNTDTTTPLFRTETALTLAGSVSLATNGLRARIRSSELGSRLRPLKWLLLRSLRAKPVPLSAPPRALPGCGKEAGPAVAGAASAPDLGRKRPERRA